jgi:hypothetical protein
MKLIHKLVHSYCGQRGQSVNIPELRIKFLIFNYPQIIFTFFIRLVGDNPHHIRTNNYSF